MTVKIVRKNDDYLMEATNDTDNTLIMDGSPDIGGVNGGFRPMQLLLAGLGGCSAIDIISILEKQRQDLQHIELEVTGERKTDEMPKTFTKIHVKLLLWGTIKPSKVEQAIRLTEEKYCSVYHMLNKQAEISYSYEIHEGENNNL